MSDRAREQDGESRDIRDRQVMEVLQELRVAITGGQILFAFLLTVPFAQRWSDTDDLQRTLFLITLLAIAAATGCFIAPTAAHRLRFHQRDRSFIVAYANFAAITGLVALMTAMVCAVLLVTDFVFSRTTAVVSTAAFGLLLLGLWFAVPLSRYRRG
jgi:predicted membrane channel-forming protein YqfA (hemolysin III family)